MTKITGEMMNGKLDTQNEFTASGKHYATEFYSKVNDTVWAAVVLQCSRVAGAIQYSPLIWYKLIVLLIFYQKFQTGYRIEL